MRVKVCDPSTHTRDSGLWSSDTVLPSLRLNQLVKDVLVFFLSDAYSVVTKQLLQRKDTVVQ